MGNNTESATAGRDGVGSVEDLIAAVVREVGHPPDDCDRAMALVIGAGGADHLGLLSGRALVSGGLGLLASALTARARPNASLLLEWLGEEPVQRRYCGWAVDRGPTQVVWRWLDVDELRTLIDPRTRQALGEAPGVGFAG
jgi:hypothetical protein